MLSGKARPTNYPAARPTNRFSYSCSDSKPIMHFVGRALPAGSCCVAEPDLRNILLADLRIILVSDLRFAFLEPHFSRYC